MSNNIVKIEVTGPSGIGKSTIVQIIKAALRAEGITGEVTGVGHHPRSIKKMEQSVQSLVCNGLSVEIHEKHDTPTESKIIWMF